MLLNPSWLYNTVGGAFSWSAYWATHDDTYSSIWQSFSTKPDVAVGLIQQDMVNDLKDEGLWDKIELFLFVNRDVDDFAINWKDLASPTTLSSPGSGISKHAYEKYGGIIGRRSSYIDSNFNPSSASLYTLDSGSIFYWLDHNQDEQDTAIMGGVYDDGGTARKIEIRPKRSSGEISANINTLSALTTAITDMDELITVVRHSGRVQIYRNTTELIDNATAAQGLPNMDLGIMGYNNLGVFSGSLTNTMRVFGIGSNLTSSEVSTLHSIISSALTKINNYRTYDYVRCADMPDNKTQHGFETIGDKLYAVGNVETGDDPKALYEYDPDTNAWTTKTPCPFTENSNQSPIVRTVNGKLYMIGGLQASATVNDDVWEYDPSTDGWTQKTAMPTAREDMGSAVYDGKIYVFGGVTTNVMEVYNPVTDTWDETKADLPVDKLLGDFGCECNGKIYAISGQADLDDYDNLHPDDSVYEYDPTEDEWTEKASIPTGCCYKECVAVGNYIYVFGGAGTGDARDPCNMLDLIQVYDTVNNTWRTSNVKLPAPMMGAAVAYYDGYFYWCGGEAYNASISAVNWLWKIRLDRI